MLPDFLRHLPEMAQQGLLEQARPIQWTRSSQIVLAQDTADTLFLLQSGHVRLYHLGHDSREITMNVVGRGELLGCRALLPEQTYGLYADTLDSVQALSLSGEVMRQKMCQHPALGAAISAQVARQSRSLQDRLAQLVFLEVSQRLALALLTLLEESQAASASSGTAVPLSGRISHQDLAYTVGSTRETITKVLGEFRERGLLDLGYRRIAVIDRAGLEHAAKTPYTSNSFIQRK